MWPAPGQAAAAVCAVWERKEVQSLRAVVLAAATVGYRRRASFSRSSSSCATSEVSANCCAFIAALNAGVHLEFFVAALVLQVFSVSVSCRRASYVATCTIAEHRTTSTAHDAQTLTHTPTRGARCGRSSNPYLPLTVSSARENGLRRTAADPESRAMPGQCHAVATQSAACAMLLGDWPGCGCGRTCESSE